MSTETPSRPSRRAARRPVVLDDESEDELSFVKEEAEEEEYTPAPTKSPRKSNPAADDSQCANIAEEVCKNATN